MFLLRTVYFAVSAVWAFGCLALAYAQNDQSNVWDGDLDNWTCTHVDVDGEMLWASKIVPTIAGDLVLYKKNKAEACGLGLIVKGINESISSGLFQVNAQQSVLDRVHEDYTLRCVANFETSQGRKDCNNVGGNKCNCFCRQVPCQLSCACSDPKDESYCESQLDCQSYCFGRGCPN